MSGFVRAPRKTPVLAKTPTQVIDFLSSDFLKLGFFEVPVIVEDRSDFASAPRSAKEIALQFQERAGIQRSATGWAVLASNTVLIALTPPEVEEAGEYDYEDYSSAPYDDEFQREVVQPLVEEMQNDQDSWARSDEDGWFYED